VSEVGFGTIVSLIFWSHLHLTIWELVMLAMLLGKVIDSIVYLELEISTPKNQIKDDLSNMLQSLLD